MEVDANLSSNCFIKIGGSSDTGTIPQDHAQIPTDYPAPRSAHKIVVDDTNLYCLGGFNPDYSGVTNDQDTNYPIFREVWKCNLATLKWSKIDTRGRTPSTLASHSAKKIFKRLYTYGGSGVTLSDSSGDELSMLVLDDTLRWYKCNCNGDIPTARYGHTMLIKGGYEGFLYLIGGLVGEEYTMTIHRLNLDSHEWEVLGNGQDPEGRYHHATVLYNDCLYNFGGGTEDSYLAFEKTDVFNLDEVSWKKIEAIPDHDHGYPQPRKGHSCALHDNYVFMCGGFNGKEIFGDLWQFNLRNNSWTKFSATLPEPSYLHSADITKDGCMYVFGGITEHGENERRTNSLYKIYPVVLSLSVLCWEAFTSCCPNLHSLTVGELLELGIPEQFVERTN